MKIANELIKIAKSLVNADDKKITKKQYFKAEEVLKQTLKYIKDALDNLKKQDDVVIKTLTALDSADFWNQLHDMQRSVELELHNLEKNFDKQEWNSQDWAEYDLVINNID